MNREDEQYVSSLVPSVYDWCLKRVGTDGVNVVLKISDCKEAFKAIPLKHLTAVFEILAADFRLLLPAAKSRVIQYVINDKHQDYLNYKEREQEQHANSSAARAKKEKELSNRSKKRSINGGLKVRPPNQLDQETTTNMVEKFFVKKTKTKLVPTKNTSELSECAQPLEVRSSSSNQAIVQQSNSAYVFVPTSAPPPLAEALGEESDAVGSLLLKAFADCDELHYQSFKEVVMAKLPNVSDENFSSIMQQFENQNKIFVDGNDIYQI